MTSGRRPVPLRAYQPMVSVSQAIHDSQALTDEERTWLTGHCEQLLHAYTSSASPCRKG